MGVVRKEISVFLTDEHANWSHSTKWSTLQVYTFKQHEKESWIWDRVEAVMDLLKEEVEKNYENISHIHEI